MSGLKFPILLVHGMGFRDRKHINYWGRIPKVLAEEGNLIFYGNQDANGSVVTNGEYLAARIRKLAEENNIEKFNVIAHSKGGLDIRYAISTLKVNDLIASVTTINSPHNGSVTLDHLLKFPKILLKFGSKFWDIGLWIGGDRKPDTFKTIMDMRTADSAEFNRMNPDDPGIYYQSYAFSCKKVTSDMGLWFTNLVVRHYEGENDGLLAERAVRWTNFRGHFRSATNRGISHFDQVDFRRRPLSRKKLEGITDITDFYRDLVRELETMGF